MSSSDIKAGAAYVELFVKDRLAPALKKAQARLKAFGAATEDLGRRLMGVGTAAAAPLALAVRAYSNLESELAKLQAAANPTAEQFERIKTAVQGISQATGTGPAAVAAALTELLKAGTSVDVALGGAAETVVQFAKVAEMDAAQAATIVSDALHVFARDGLTAAQAVDILSQAADSSSIGLEQIAQSFSMASAVAGAAGVSLQELAAAIGVLGNQGLKGSDAGTAMKTMLLALMAPSDTAAGAIKKFGLEFRDAAGQVKPIRSVIEELTAKLGGLDSATRDQALKDIFGTDAIRPALILMQQGVDGWDQFVDAMAKGQSVADKYQRVMGTLSGAWQTLSAGAERLGAAIGEALAPEIERLGKWLMEVAQLAQEWVRANKETIVTIAKVAAGVAAAGAA